MATATAGFGNCQSRHWQLPQPALATAKADFGSQSRLWKPPMATAKAAFGTELI